MADIEIKALCQQVTTSNGVKDVRLAGVLNGVPTKHFEMIPSDKFRVGDDWLIEFTRVKRGND